MDAEKKINLSKRDKLTEEEKRGLTPAEYANITFGDIPQRMWLGYSIKTIGEKEVSTQSVFWKYLTQAMQEILNDKQYSEAKVKNYLYLRTPWPDMSCEDCKKIVERTLRLAAGDDDFVEEKVINNAKKRIEEVYNAIDFLNAQINQLPSKKAELAADVSELFSCIGPFQKYVISRNLKALSSLNSDDITFFRWVCRIGQEEQEKKTAEYSKELSEYPAQHILDSLLSPEVEEWRNMLTKDYTDSFRKLGKVEVPPPKFEALKVRQIMSLSVIMLIVLEKAARDESEQVPFNESEIKLLLLFKYCLPSYTKDRICRRIRQETTNGS